MKISNQNKLLFIFSLISIVILTFLFKKLLFGSYSFIGPDSLSPQAIRQGIEMIHEETGEYPLWLPWVFSGLPSVHSFQNISEFYFPHYIYLFFNKIFGVPFIWNYIVHFIFGGIGCVLLLKRLKVDNLSAIFGGLAFIFTPYLITMVVHGHGSQMMTSVYIPWVVWGIHKLISKPKIHNVGILALIIGLQLQRAHVQIAYYTWMLVGLYLLLILINQISLLDSKQNKFCTIAMISTALLIGLGIALNIYIPALEYASYSIRGGTSGGAGFEYATQWSFSLLESGTFILPSFFGFGGLSYWGQMPFTDYPNYMGIIVLILAIIGGFKSNQKEKFLFLLAILFAFLLSLGKNFSLFFGIFYDYFPYFNKFRVPVMILIIMQFSVSILSALGLNYIRKNFQLFEINKILKGIMTSLISLSFFILVFGKEIIYTFLPTNDLLQRYGVKAQELINNLRYNNIIDEIQFMIIITFLLSLLFYLYKNKIIKWSILASCIILVSLIDLSIVNKKIIEPKKESYRSNSLNPSIIKNRYLVEDEVIQFLKSDSMNYRIFPVGQLSNQNRWSAFGIESIYGYHPAKLNNYNLFMNNVGFENPNVLQMLNVKYLISLQELEHPLFKKVFSGKLYHNNKYLESHVYYFVGFLERAFFVDKLKFLNDNIISYVKNNNESFVKESVIKKDIENKIFFGSRDVKIIKKWPNKIELITISDTEQFLVLSEIYYPEGWSAYINDKETEIYEVNSILRGILIPSGSNEISFVFNPIDIKLGSFISSFCLVISLLFIIIGFYKKDEK